MMNKLLKVSQRAASTLTKEAGDISSVFPSMSGKVSPPLPARYSDLKKRLIRGNEDAVKASWQRLLTSLRRELEEIHQKGNSLVPSIEFDEVAEGSVTKKTVDAIKHRGCTIIRNVLPKQQTLDLKAEAQSYIKANKSRVRGFPRDDPAVFELYWTPTQVKARSHPNLLRTQTFLSRLWHSSNASSEISTTYPLTYADRFRIRKPGDSKFALGPHCDGGSIERWEDEQYSRVYSKILEGKWEEYDPMDAAYRATATMDMYNGAGSCSMFRLFQGWLSMSSTGPTEGTLRLYPLVKQTAAYLLLRPFFDLRTGELNLDNTFPNTALGASQEFNSTTHPDLDLGNAMISMPKVEPGDYVAWHCDTIHSVESDHRGTSDSSVLYIPACAVTKGNIDFLKRQRMAALRYSPPPDFPGAGSDGEIGFDGATDWNAVGEEGKQAMGLGSMSWAVKEGMSEGERKVLEEGNQALFL